jgi:DNA polymerase-3 subunit epsilon
VDPQTYFDPLNISIHGITAEMVQGAPRFPDIHSNIQDLVRGCVVVTHMPFDQTALRRAAGEYDLPEISCTWLDSARVVRRHWEQFRQSGYSLPKIAAHLKIDYEAHNAADDARAAGEVLLAAMRESGQSLEEWLVRAYKTISSNVKIAQEGNPDGPLYGETMVFTGALSLPRKDAARMAASTGCNVGEGVTRDTTILVVGIQTRDRLAGYDKSSKHRKTEELISAGQAIRIITEKDFIDMVGL